MLKRVLETIKENNLLKAGDKVVCALSGGADSMALLCALYEIKDEIGIEVYAAHLNHSIRGKDADEDYLFVKDFCERMGVRLFYRKVDVPLLAKALHKGEEETGRIERYKLFYDAAEELGGAKIATGHHQNDNAETVLFNLFRGSGAKGLCGIPYRRDMIIRPLLDVSRRDTESYLEEKGISWREDETNKECKYSRNKIRHIVLNAALEIFPDAVKKIAAASRIISTDDEYLTRLAEESGAFEDGKIDKERFCELHESLRRRVIMTALSVWGVKDIDFVKIRLVTGAVLGSTGKVYDLGNNVRVINSYGKVYRLTPNENDIYDNPIPVPIGENLEIKAFEGIWSIKTVDKTEKMRDNKMMILLDAEKLSEGVQIRQRRDGDFISPAGIQGTKKLKKVFIDLKIPKDIRDRISMLTMGSEILFIPGIRKTRNYLPDENTKKVLVIEYKG